MSSSSEPFPKGDEMGPDVPDETKASMTEATLHIKAFSALLRKLGSMVEPRFTVSLFCYLFLSSTSSVTLSYSSSPRD